MTRVGCSNHVSTALENIEGVVEQTVKYSEDVATIKCNTIKTNPAEMTKAIKKAGYNADIIKETILKRKSNEHRNHKTRHHRNDLRALCHRH